MLVYHKQPIEDVTNTIAIIFPAIVGRLHSNSQDTGRDTLNAWTMCAFSLTPTPQRERILMELSLYVGYCGECRTVIRGLLGFGP